MAEFSKALEINREQFIADRLEAVRAAGRIQWKRGNKLFMAAQHAYFLLAYGDCKCQPAHSCGGCAITLAIATKLEEDIAKLDPIACDQEEARANAFWTRKWLKLGTFLTAVWQRADAIKKEREARSTSLRSVSIRQDQKEESRS